MGIKYKYLTGIFLRIMLDKGYAKSKIAKLLKVNPSTIYREIKSNSIIHRVSGERIYWNHIAQEIHFKRRKKRLKLEQDTALREYVQWGGLLTKLEGDLSEKMPVSVSFYMKAFIIIFIS